MKLKIALLLAAVTLTGCQAGSFTTNGDLAFKSGTGLTYSRGVNQCGGPCDRYDDIKIERPQLGNPGDFEREQEALRRSAIAGKCQMLMDGYLEAVKARYLEAYLTGGPSAAEYKKYKKKYIEGSNNYLTHVNNCTDKSLKEEQ